MKNAATVATRMKVVILIEEENEATRLLLSRHLGQKFEITILAYVDFLKLHAGAKVFPDNVDCYYFHHVKLFDRGIGHRMFKFLEKHGHNVSASVLTFTNEKNPQIFDFETYQHLETAIFGAPPIADSQKN
jgi:hypothetical protein